MSGALAYCLCLGFIESQNNISDEEMCVFVSLCTCSVFGKVCGWLAG